MILTPTITPLGVQTARYTISGGTSPYRWYRNGELVFEGDEVERIIETPDSILYGDFEIFDADETSTPQTLQFTRKKALQWRGNRNVAQYVVSRLVGATLVPEFVVLEQGRGYYQAFISPPENEATVYQVQAIDRFGNAGNSASFSVQIISLPAPPQVTISWSDANSRIEVASV